MIEIVRSKNPKARQPWHVRITAEGNDEPLQHGEQLTDLQDVGTELAAVGRQFSPVDRAEYVGGPSGGVLTVWIDEDEHGQRLHVPVELVDEREPVAQAVPDEPPAGDPPSAKKATSKRTTKKAAAAEGGATS